MSDRSNLIHAQPDHGGYYAVALDGLGIFITAGLDDYGQPYVSVNTEDMTPEHTYDEATGLPGTARPYIVTQEDDDGSYGVAAPDRERGHIVIANHYPQPEPVHARLAAQKHADMLNDLWPTVCGMPMISVHLGDVELYDAREHGAPKTKVLDAPEASRATPSEYDVTGRESNDA